VRPAHLRSIEPFGIPIKSLGLVVGYGEMQGLIALVGRAVALGILLEGRVFGAEKRRAKAGEPVVPDDNGPEESLAAARRIADGARSSRAGTRKFRGASPSALPDQDRRDEATPARHRDFKIGVKAFLAQAKAEFKGK